MRNPGINTWIVMWEKDGTKLKKTFYPEDGRPSSAIVYVKELRSQGFLPALVSGRKGFRPSSKQLLERPSGRHMWCPYCITWRLFEFNRIKRSGLTGPSLLHCPVCTISSHDGNVRKYNRLDELLLV